MRRPFAQAGTSPDPTDYHDHKTPAPVGAMHPSPAAQTVTTAHPYDTIRRSSHERHRPADPDAAPRKETAPVPCELPRHKNPHTRRGDASVARSAIDRSGTSSRYDLAIVTREASPGRPRCRRPQRNSTRPLPGGRGARGGATDRTSLIAETHARLG